MKGESLSKLRSFIVFAHLNTYASETAKPEEGAFGKKIFKYTRSNLGYQDEYYAKDNFMGQEMVYHIDESGPGGPDDVPKFIPLWSMVYRGGVLLEGIKAQGLSTEQVYTFLKKALRDVMADVQILPIRGPKRLQDEEWLYHNFCETKNILSFSGKEEIFYKGIKVYECRYSGGGLALISG